MPKWIGQNPTSLMAQYGPKKGDIRLTWRQAYILYRHGFPIRYSTCTWDKGGPGRLAKHWHQWWANPADVAKCEESTLKMREKALQALKRQLGFYDEEVL